MGVLKIDFMEKKYFRPKPSELREGYECEIREKLRGMGIYAQMTGNVEYHKKYAPVIIGKEFPVKAEQHGEFSLKNFENMWRNIYNSHPSVQEALSLLKANKLRTRYLDPELLKKEGWKQGMNPNGMFKGNATIDFLNGKGNIIISRFQAVCFCGECKDINTFRQLCKLIGIK